MRLPFPDNGGVRRKIEKNDDFLKNQLVWQL